MYLNGKRFILYGKNNLNNNSSRNYFLLLSFLLLFFSNAANSAVDNHSSQILVNEAWSDVCSQANQADVSPLLVLGSILLADLSGDSMYLSDKVYAVQVVSVIRPCAVIELTHSLGETSLSDAIFTGSTSGLKGESISQSYDLAGFEKGVVTC
jgi:hypothetical protein